MVVVCVVADMDAVTVGVLRESLLLLTRKDITTMTAPHIIDPAGLLSEALAEASPDLMCDLLQTMINALLLAGADAVVGAEWGKPSPDRLT